MRLACLALATFVALAAPAAAFDANDRTFEDGRVGAIVGGTTKPEDLARIYGANNVVLEKMDELGGGQMHPGARVFRDGADALEVHFSDDGKTIEYVNISGPNWRSKEGLRVGMGVADIERLNGGPFTFYGFGFDYGGQVFAGGPALKPFTLFIFPKNAKQEDIKGLYQPEAQVSSRHPAVPAAHLEVGFIQVRIRKID